MYELPWILVWIFAILLLSVNYYQGQKNASASSSSIWTCHYKKLPSYGTKVLHFKSHKSKPLFKCSSRDLWYNFQNSHTQLIPTADLTVAHAKQSWPILAILLSKKLEKPHTQPTKTRSSAGGGGIQIASQTHLIPPRVYQTFRSTQSKRYHLLHKLSLPLQPYIQLVSYYYNNCLARDGGGGHCLAALDLVLSKLSSYELNLHPFILINFCPTFLPNGVPHCSLNHSTLNFILTTTLFIYFTKYIYPIFFARSGLRNTWGGGNLKIGGFWEGKDFDMV